MMRIVTLLVLLTAVLAAPSALSQAPAAEYRIGPRDVLEVKVFQDASFNGVVTVDGNGRIQLPYQVEVDVNGLTAREAAARIKSVLEARFINNADVSVIVQQFLSKPISIFGAVNSPGKLAISGRMTLIEAISQAGGVGAGAKKIYVLRNAANGITDQIIIDVEDLMVRGNPDFNIPLAPNDIVNVMGEKLISIFLIGEVMKPGEVKIVDSPRPTLVQVLAAAGGFTDRANRAKISVRRKAADGTEKVFEIDARRIMDGKEADFQLQENDTVFVRESFF